MFRVRKLEVLEVKLVGNFVRTLLLSDLTDRTQLTASSQSETYTLVFTTTCHTYTVFVVLSTIITETL